MGMIDRMREDIAAARIRDPAARSGAEVALLYPGLHAIWAHRVSHALWRRRLPVSYTHLTLPTTPYV